MGGPKMDSGSSASAASPTVPEPVKYAEADVVKTRENARAAAIRRFGVIGTDKTSGALAGAAVETKQKTLGN